MNVSELEKLLRSVQDDFATSNQPALIQNLRNTLHELANNPGDANIQQGVLQSRRDLEKVLRKAPSNSFPARWKAGVKDLGMDEVLGERLLSRVQSAFIGNEITPAAIHEQVSNLTAETERADEAVRNVLSGLGVFDIEPEPETLGMCELEYEIPRSAVDNGLKSLTKEFAQLNRQLAVFYEIGGEGRPEPIVRSISSSEFSLLLLLPYSVCLPLAKACEHLASAYKQIQEARLIKSQVSANPVLGGQALDEMVEGQVKEYLDRRVPEIAREVISDHLSEASNGGREHELETELSNSLNAILTRLDRGFTLTFQLNSPVESADSTEVATQISNANKSLEDISNEGEPILELSPPPEIAIDQDSVDGASTHSDQ